jgi:hypothetical protein
VSQGLGKRLHDLQGSPIEGLDRIVQGQDSPFISLDNLDLRVRPGSEAARPGDAVGAIVPES